MLVDVKLEMWAVIAGYAPRRVDLGVYDNCGFNFHNAVEGDFASLYMFRDEPEEIPSYGVADSIEQFMSLYGKMLRESPRAYAVGFTEVRREDQSPKGDWRWRKWGKYIGTKTPTAEYLYDEPEIESVMTFSVLRRKDKS